MALGKPAVLTPKALDLRAVQGTISAIRERLQAIEQAVTVTTARANSSTASGDVTALQAQLRQLAARVSAVEAAVSGGGDSEVDLVAFAAIAAGDPVVMVGPNNCAPANGSDPTAIYAVVGLAQTAAAEGQSVTVTRWGNFTVIGGTFDEGRAVYANEGGGLTQYPSYTDVAIPLGVATGADTMWVSPAWPSLRALGFESGYEDFLPPTVGLVRDAVLLTDDFNAAASGIAVKTGENDVTTRTLTGTAARVSVADGSGVSGNPTVDIDAAYVGQTSITTLGTVATGTWAGTTIAPDHGGTGVANDAGSTITLGGALTLAGAFTSTFTLTGVTSVTFPTSGTLATTSQLPTGANPTASVGLAAVDGVATTFMRSDAAPALSQAIAPTWTAKHIFSANAAPLPALANTLVHVGSADGAAGFVVFDGFGTGGALVLRRANTSAATPSAVQANQNLGSIAGHGYGATAYNVAARVSIGLAATENWTDAAQGTRVDIETTPIGSTTRSAVLRVSDAAVALLKDNQELQVGAGTDLRISHDGTDSIVRNDTGNLLFKAGATTYYTLAASGASTFASTVTGNAFIPSDSTVPVNGMYLPAANNLGWAVNSAVAMRLNATGLGVGRTPAQKLDVEGTASASQVVARIGNTSGNNGAQAVLCLDPSSNGFNSRDSQIRATNNGLNQTTLEFYTSNAGAGPAEAMRITAGSLVGIGITNPQTTLHVKVGVWSAGFADQGRCIYSRAEGTVASPTAISGAAVLGQFSFRGYDGTNYRDAALIRSSSDGAVSSSSAPGNLELMTTPSGSTTPLARQIISSVGDIVSNVTGTAPTLAGNSQMVFNLTSNTNLRVSVRGTDGTTRVANITLA